MDFIEDLKKEQKKKIIISLKKQKNGGIQQKQFWNNQLQISGQQDQLKKDYLLENSDQEGENLILKVKEKFQDQVQEIQYENEVKQKQFRFQLGSQNQKRKQTNQQSFQSSEKDKEEKTGTLETQFEDYPLDQKLGQKQKGLKNLKFLLKQKKNIPNFMTEYGWNQRSEKAIEKKRQEIFQSKTQRDQLNLENLENVTKMYDLMDSENKIIPNNVVQFGKNNFDPYAFKIPIHSQVKSETGKPSIIQNTQQNQQISQIKTLPSQINFGYKKSNSSTSNHVNNLNEKVVFIPLANNFRTVQHWQKKQIYLNQIEKLKLKTMSNPYFQKVRQNNSTEQSLRNTNILNKLNSPQFNHFSITQNNLKNSNSLNPSFFNSTQIQNNSSSNQINPNTTKNEILKYSDFQNQILQQQKYVVKTKFTDENKINNNTQNSNNQNNQMPFFILKTQSNESVDKKSFQSTLGKVVTLKTFSSEQTQENQPLNFQQFKQIHLNQEHPNLKQQMKGKKIKNKLSLPNMRVVIDSKQQKPTKKISFHQNPNEKIEAWSNEASQVFSNNVSIQPEEYL